MQSSDLSDDDFSDSRQSDLVHNVARSLALALKLSDGATRAAAVRSARLQEAQKEKQAMKDEYEELCQEGKKLMDESQRLKEAVAAARKANEQAKQERQRQGMCLCCKKYERQVALVHNVCTTGAPSYSSCLCKHCAGELEDGIKSGTVVCPRCKQAAVPTAGLAHMMLMY